MSEAAIAARARYVFVICVVATILIYQLPQLHRVAYPLLLISTLVHELGHGLAALMVGASFDRFQMYPDGSGVAMWSGSVSGTSRAFIAAGGLVGPAIAAAFCFFFARRPGSARACLAVLGGLLVIAELAVVRNSFGALFVGVMAAVCLLIAWKGGAQLAQLGLAFLAAQLAMSVYARSDYLFMQYAQTAEGQMPSDSEQIARAMEVGSYQLWGAVCAVVSAVILIAGCWYFLRSHRPVPVRNPRPVK